MRTAVLIALAVAAAVAAGAVVLASIGGGREPIVDVSGGDPEAGRAAIEDYGCGSCHTIDGIESTDKHVGPPLVDFAERRYVAGDEPNRPDVLIRWIRDPQSFEPGTIMPDLGVSEADARDIAAYLYSD